MLLKQILVLFNYFTVVSAIPSKNHSKEKLKFLHRTDGEVQAAMFILSYSACQFNNVQKNMYPRQSINLKLKYVS